MTLEKGALLHNRYRIEDTIAAGGMGAVYRAHDEILGIFVAVKENFFSTEEYSRQFRREATILASLRHPNLPRVTDHFVIPAQGQYLVMDFIEGEDLRELISSDGKLPEDEVIRIGVAICDALDYLHSRNPAIVHRDVKPGNIKISPAGQVYLVDFGLAKLGHGEATTTGAQALTPGYAPPEQYGQGTEPRSDIYALGATLYAALTGKIPEDGLSRAMGSAELTPVRKHNPQVSDPVARVIERAMATIPADRYPEARDFREGLLSAAPRPVKPVEKPAEPPEMRENKTGTADRPQPIQPAVVSSNAALKAPGAAKEEAIQQAQPPVSSQRRRPAQRRRRVFPLGAVLGVGGVAALAGLGVILFSTGLINSYFMPQPTATPAPATITPLPMTATTAPPPPASPTSSLAPTQTITQASTPTPLPTDTPIPVATNAPTITVTPIGGASGQIAYAAVQNGKTQIWVIQSDGTGARRVTDLEDGACQPDWSPDGKRLVFISPCQGKKDLYPDASLWIINADGTGLTPLDTQQGGEFEPAWSPDGSQIAFTTLRDNGIPHIYLYTLADNKTRQLSRQVSHDRQPAWSPDGKRLAYETTRNGVPQIWIMSAAGENAQDFSILAGAYDFAPGWSPDGNTLVFSHGSQPILVARQVGDKAAQQVAISDQVRPAEEPRFSRDGGWLAFTAKQDGNLDIYVIMRDGSNLARLTTNAGADFHPTWRP